MTVGRVVTRHTVLNGGSFTLGKMKALTITLPDDYEENKNTRLSVLAFSARPDHNAQKSQLNIYVNRLPGHTSGLKSDHTLLWSKGVGFDQGFWWPVPAGKLVKGKKNTIEFARTGGSEFGNVRVRAVVLWYNRMLRVPKNA